MKKKWIPIVMALVFAVFLGFAGLENYLTLLAVAVILWAGALKQDFSKSLLALVLILLLHTGIYYINYSDITLDWFAKNMMNPVILFFAGYWLAHHSGETKKPVLIMLVGFFVHAALNLGIYFINPYSLEERAFANIWGGEITATLHNLLFIPVVGLLFYGLYMAKGKQRWAILLACVVALYGTLVSASRTLLFLIVICFAVNVIMNMRRNHVKSMRTVISVMVLVIGLAVLYQMNVAGVRTWVGTSELAKRFAEGLNENDGVLTNSRWEMAAKVLAALPDNPFGKITVVNYAHNLFLDVAKYTGIFPSVGLFVWCLVSLAKSFPPLKNPETTGWDVAVFSIAIGFMIAFFLEPVFEGMPLAFGAFCYLCGVMKYRREQLTRQAKEAITGGK